MVLSFQIFWMQHILFCWQWKHYTYSAAIHSLRANDLWYRTKTWWI